jgi:primosomal protein N' (replication factor Y) (superfamily II helicase)
VLNRAGVASLLSCRQCSTVAACERCGASVASVDGQLRCLRCGTVRPLVCLRCGSTRLGHRKPGVARLRTDLTQSLGEAVGEVSKDGVVDGDARVVVGTEAVLHHVDQATLVAFIDLDAELLAPRFRAAEQALSLLVRAVRLVGPRAAGGRVAVQTRLPRHEVIQAALLADPDRVAGAEWARRQALALPPAAALAELSGPAAAEAVHLVAPTADVLGPDDDGRWLVRAPSFDLLAEALVDLPRAPSRVRIDVSPRR